MYRLTFAASAVLATIGMALGVTGIQGSSANNVATAFILLLGAGVFAILSLGGRGLPPNGRRIAQHTSSDESQDAF